MMAIAKADSLNAIFVGGTMQGDEFIVGTEDRVPIIARMDLE